MASNTAEQNPSNKVGRNSGAGPGGVTEMIPTAREARRGVRPIDLDHNGRRFGPLALGVGAALVVGAGVTALAIQRDREQRTLRHRVKEAVGWR